MALHFDLDPNHVTVDDSLAHCVPPALAAYYLALPLAREDGRASVVMAHPENDAAVQTLSRLLQAEVIPLHSSAEAIQAVLARLYPSAAPAAPKILAWSDAPEWETAVTAAAAAFSRVLEAPVTGLLTGAPLSEALAIARQGSYDLTVLHLPERMPLTAVMRQSATPILLVRGHHDSLRHILVALRGFASDTQTLDWMAPFALLPGEHVTILPLAGGLLNPGGHHHPADQATSAHLEHCLRRLQKSGIQANLKFRQGHPVQQVIDELEQGEYDLLLVAAEAEGSFVTRLLTAVDAQHLHAHRPIFILKPPAV
ncbi:MAG: hypothetical protein KC441_05305 [Anaerolineales bacterium]|nr:hypothetical protein [Anaerolineales bacterium]